MSRAISRVRRWHSVYDVQDSGDVEFVADYPFQSIGEQVKEERGAPKPKGENCVKKIKPFPLHP